MFFSPFRPLIKGWLLSFSGWSLVALSMALHGVTTRNDLWSVHLEPSLRDWLPWAVFTPLLFRLVARLPLDRHHWKQAAPVHLLSLVCVIGAAHWWKENFNLNRQPGLEPSRFYPEPAGPPFEGPHRFPHGHRPPPPRPVDAQPPEWANRPPWPPPPRPGRRPPNASFDMLQFVSSDLPIYLMILAGAHTALFFRRDQERAASLARARLEALRMQLQPHFLFNTLNTIAGLVHEEPDKADAMLSSLGTLLRLSLETSNQLELPLSRELEFIEHYLEIMRTRFEERLLFQLDIASETRAALVPPMLLYSLVANALEHGLQHKLEGGLLTVRARRENATLHLTVTDNDADARAEPRSNEQIGLAATALRLRELYGNRAALHFYNEDGVTIELTLPFRPKEPSPERPQNAPQNP